MQKMPSHRPANDLRQQPAWIIAPITLLLAVVGGFIVSQYPLLLIPIVGAVGLLVLATTQRRIESMFLVSLGVLVLGYVFMGKGFAYIGIPPLYVGELGILLGIAALVFGHVRIRLTPVELMLLLFMFLGLLRTIPYLGSEGVNAVRDAAVWYYGIYAILVSSLLTERRLRIAIRGLSKVLPALVIWLAFMPVIIRFLPASVPRFPGSPQPIISVTKPGDRGVVLLMLAAFVITGLYSRLHGARRMSAPFFWSCWLVGAMMVAGTNRGGMLAMLLGLLLLMLLEPSIEWLHPVAIGTAAISVILIWNPTIDTGGYRQLSAQQLTANFTSIFSDDTENLASVQGTKEWRLRWWAGIYEDTVQGPDFWTGKGFGLNLASEYGFTGDDGGSLRSPHSVHLTILARMGVPGLVLWAMLQLAFANQIVHAFRRSRQRGDTFWASLYAWILPIWLAALVHASFDVFLEGPQGAIPFWCVFGAGLAAIRLEHVSRAVATAGSIRAP